MEDYKDEVKGRVYSYWYEHENYDKKCCLANFYGMPYYSQKIMKINYSGENYNVIGAIGDDLIGDIGNILYKGVKRPFQSTIFETKTHHITGYVRVGKDDYLAVVEKKRSKRIIFGILSLILLVLILFGGWAVYKNDSNLDPLVKEYTPKTELNLEVDVDHIAIPGFGSVTMEAGKAVSYLALWNPATNPCYFKYTILMKETGNVLYESGLIPPGQAVVEQALKQTVPEGQYDIQMKIDCFALEDETQPLNGSVVNVTLLAIKP